MSETEKNNDNSVNKMDIQQEVYNSISCGVLSYTIPQRAIIAINKEAERIIGTIENGDPIKHLFKFLDNDVHPDDREAVEKIFRSFKNVGDAEKFQFRIMRGGNIMYVQMYIKLLLFENSQEYILCTMLDITPRAKLTNDLVREKKTYREALFENSEFHFSFDVTEGMLTEKYETAHGVDLFGMFDMEPPVSYDELLKKYCEHTKIELADESMAKNFTSRGLIEAYEKGVTNAVSEFYSPLTDTYLRTNCLLSKDDETGHIFAAVVAEDITRMRKKEREQQQALQDANDLLSKTNEEINSRIDAILDGISGGLKIFDPDNDYRCTYISEGAAKLQGYTLDEYIEIFGSKITGNIHPDMRGKVFEEAKKQIEQSGSYKLKYSVTHRDGDKKYVIARGKQVIDPKTGRRLWYSLMQDVTELETRNAQIRDLLSMQKEMSESLSSGFFAYTLPERNLLIFNNAARNIFGRMGINDHNLHSSLMDIIPQNERTLISAQLRELKKPGDRAAYTFHPVTLDSDYLAIKCDTKMLSFANGQVYILSSINDITEQELTEKRLDEERKQYRKALTYDSSFIFSVNLNKGIMKDNIISQKGRSLAEILGIKLPITYDEYAANWLSVERIITDDPEAEILKSRDKLIASYYNGKSVIEIKYHVPYENKYFRVLTILYNIRDHINATFIIYDITERMSEEKQKRLIIDSVGKVYSALYLFKLNDNSFVSLKQHDDIADVLSRANSYTDFINIYKKKFVEKEFAGIVADFLDPDTIRKNLAREEYTNIEYRRKGFGWCGVTLVVCDRNHDGSVASVVFAGQIIEEQKQAEMAQQEAIKAAYHAANVANSAKTDFLANMSHDIRTPMNAIIGLTAIAGTHMDDKEKVSDCLSKITVSSKHLLGIINDVLDMSKIESGKMELSETEFNLPDLIDNLLIMSKPSINEKNHNLTVNIKDIEHENVYGDSQRLQQVFMNLMSNAVKYTPQCGHISLTISEAATVNPKVGCYEFVFEDNGIGMSKDFMEHIFEPFERARNDSRIDKIQGTGLGMPITRNIIQMMNGDIKIESELNKGTRITVTFFLKLMNEDEKVSYDKFVDLPVLVVDDDEVSCVYTCDILDEMGMKGEWVTSGRQAVDITCRRHEAERDFFAVIVDWRMPEMDGIETTRQIRKAVGKDVPIIIISAYDWSDIELEARAAGASAFISKPLFKSRMLHLFNRLIDEPESENAVSEQASFSSDDFSGKRALLVEDNEINAEIAGEILSMAGLEIEYAVNGKEAVDILSGENAERFDVVFMDIQMPVMNGYEAVRAIRALPGSFQKSVPIIAMTANAFAEDVAAAKNAGMNEHIAKPLDFPHLIKTLKKWLN